MLILIVMVTEDFDHGTQNTRKMKPPAAITTEKPGVFTLELPRKALEQMSGKFPEGVVVLVCPPTSLLPEFIRLPKAGELCPVTGLPRTTLIELLQDAGPEKIKVRHLRKRGASTGISLIPRGELIAYIHEQPAPEWQTEDG